jgi:hypothetical protein
VVSMYQLEQSQHYLTLRLQRRMNVRMREKVNEGCFLLNALDYCNCNNSNDGGVVGGDELASVASNEQQQQQLVEVVKGAWWWQRMKHNKFHSKMKEDDEEEDTILAYVNAEDESALTQVLDTPFYKHLASSHCVAAVASVLLCSIAIPM